MMKQTTLNQFSHPQCKLSHRIWKFLISKKNFAKALISIPESHSVLLVKATFIYSIHEASANTVLQWNSPHDIIRGKKPYLDTYLKNLKPISYYPS